MPYYEYVKVFSIGQIFSYFALENRKRTVTIIILEDCEFDVITKQIIINC